ncbi:Transcription factor LHW [Sesamum angolense]|uniref:Transcription factor LHW n=1 Tax=Sesamum angolense TaxID=2727404 RepID=A0AAE1WMC5_9LAMI|nr:Transcription factor LHW [Sesamum angolense]
MGMSFLGSFLQSLCSNSPWNYAVFWKLKHQHEMVLEWEDGFCDNLGLRDPMVGPDALYFEKSNKILSSPGEYPVGLAVAEMSSASHVMGKGVVGEAAFTGNTRWIYADNVATDVFNSVLAPEYPDEWLLQFAAGIKTILLLPVIPHGVLQLGSMEMVAEDPALVDLMKVKFEAHAKPDGCDWRYSFQQFPLWGRFEHVCRSDDTSFHGSRFCNTSVWQEADTLENVIESEFRQQSLDFERTMYGNFMNELMDFNSEEGATDPSLVGIDFNGTICENGSNYFSFPVDCELYKALGTAVEDDTYQHTNGTSIGHDVACHSIGDREPSYGVSGVESVGVLMKEVDVEHLLEAVVANASSSLDDDSSNKSDVTSVSMSLRKDLASSRKRAQTKHRASVEEDKVLWDFLTSEFITEGIDTAASSVESKICAFPNKKQHRKGYGPLNTGKLSRLSTTNKRKARTGDNQRSRPRDRQLIQDRIKELRELVPSTEKCSIDGLLDKTIKHMLFLRSVTNQADKLRHQVLEEEVDEKTTRTAEVNYGHQNGKSWAVELGTEQQLCPIVVKDLEHSGHMLIEMLCPDHGRFLEIADAIHRLQLTILQDVRQLPSPGYILASDATVATKSAACLNQDLSLSVLIVGFSCIVMQCWRLFQRFNGFGNLGVGRGFNECIAWTDQEIGTK